MTEQTREKDREGQTGQAKAAGQVLVVVRRVAKVAELM